MVKKNVLGKGLEALLKDYKIQPAPSSNEQMFKMVPIKSVLINPLQPRKQFDEQKLVELRNSIQTYGLIHPPTVRQLPNNHYQLIVGERRLRAAKLAALEMIPVYIRTTNDKQMLELALVENIQRAALNPMEISVSYERLLTECDLTQEALAARVGKDRTTINNYLRLLKLPPAIQVALRDRVITMGHARPLIALSSLQEQLYCLKKIQADVLSVRQVEQMVQAFLHKKTVAQIKETEQDVAFKINLEDTTAKLEERLEAKIDIRANANRQGAIKVFFKSEQELEKIVLSLLKRQ